MVAPFDLFSFSLLPISDYSQKINPMAGIWPNLDSLPILRRGPSRTLLPPDSPLDPLPALTRLLILDS